MYRIGKYSAADPMCDLVLGHYPVLLVMSRFGIAFGVGDKSIGEVCRQNGVDTVTFLAVVNLLTAKEPAEAHAPGDISVEALVEYLRNSHRYFLDYRLPALRRSLVEAVGERGDVAMAIIRFFDEYVQEVRRHMDYEERKVFPYVQALLAGSSRVGYSIDEFSRHHSRVEAKLSELKQILIRYYPSESTNELTAVLYGIFACEQELSSHNAVEDRILIPAIERCEKGGGR